MLTKLLPGQKVSVAKCLCNDVSVEQALAQNVPHARGQLDLDGRQISNFQISDFGVESDGREVLEQRAVNFDVAVPVGLKVDLAHRHRHEEHSLDLVIVSVLERQRTRV